MIQTGLVDLDRQVGGGFTEGQMVVVSARPGKGKTTLVMQAAEHVAHRFPDELVVVVSLEMPRVQLTTRRVAAASDGRLTVHQLKNPGGLMTADEFPIVEECLGKLAPNVEVCDRASQDIDSLVASIRDMAGRHKVALVVVDYLQLVQTKSASKSDTREQAVSRVSRALKVLALDIGCPVIVVAQMSRDIEKSVTGRRPVLADLRESGAIEQDADIVIFLHADADLDSTAERKPVEAIVAKARDGGEGIVGLVFHGAWGRFENLAPTELERRAPEARSAEAAVPGRKGGRVARGVEAARFKAHAEAQRSARSVTQRRLFDETL